jgi:hypothetical protein
MKIIELYSLLLAPDSYHPGKAVIDIEGNFREDCVVLGEDGAAARAALERYRRKPTIAQGTDPFGKPYEACVPAEKTVDVVVHCPVLPGKPDYGHFIHRQGSNFQSGDYGIVRE